MPKLKKALNASPTTESPAISQTTTDQLYQTASRLFEEKKFKEAIPLYILLTTLNPYGFDYWLGLGLCEQQNFQYESALVAFEMATWTDDNHPAPHIYASECYTALNGKTLAKDALEKAIFKASKYEKYRPIKELALKKQQQL